MKKTLSLLSLMMFSALSLNASLVCYAPMDSETAGITGGALTTLVNSTYRDGGLFGSGASKAGSGQWGISLGSSMDVTNSWSFSFFSYIGNNQASNQWGSALIATGNNAYADSFSNGFQVYLKGETGNGLVVKGGNASGTDITGTSYARDSWNHIGLSYSNGVMSVFINGVKATDITTSYNAGASFSQLLNHGAAKATANTGVKEISLWDQALTADQMMLLATGTSPLNIPEPATASLGALGLAALFLRRRRA